MTKPPAIATFPKSKPRSPTIKNERAQMCSTIGVEGSSSLRNHPSVPTILTIPRVLSYKDFFVGDGQANQTEIDRAQRLSRVSRAFFACELGRLNVPD